MEDLLWQIQIMFTGDLEKITLHQQTTNAEKSRCFSRRIKGFHNSVRLKKGWSFLTMMIEVGKILECSEGNVETYKPTECSACGYGFGYGSETEYTLYFWEKA